MRFLALFLLLIGCALAQAGERQEMERLADAAAARHGIPVALLKGVCRTESSWQPRAIGDDGKSFGACQIQIDTALDAYGKGWMRGKPEHERRESMRRHLLDPAANIQLAARLLRDYLDRFGGDETLAVLAYNGGQDHKMLRHILRFRAARASYEATP